MRIIFVLLVLGFSVHVRADSQCKDEVIASVAKFTTISEYALSVMGSFREGETVISFVADTVEESAVYEVKSSAYYYCAIEGIFEHGLYSDEFRLTDMEEISIFKTKL